MADDGKYRPPLVVKPSPLENPAPAAAASGDKTTRALRDMLFDEMYALKDGRGNVQRALAMSKIAGQIVNIARTEIQFAKMAKDGVGTPTDLVSGEGEQPKALTHDPEE